MYRVDPDRARRIVEECESLTEELRNAELLQIGKQIEAELAREKAAELKKRNK